MMPRIQTLWYCTSQGCESNVCQVQYTNSISYPIVVVVPASRACETILILLILFQRLMYEIASKQVQFDPRNTAVY